MRVALALVFIVALTFVLHRFLPVNTITVGLLYLVAVLFVATKGGIVESSVASVAAMFCFNFFFLPPIGTLTISDPQNWVALFAFLATSLTASQLSAGARRRALEAEARRSEVEQLYSLSRALLLMDPTQAISRQIVQHIVQTCECPSVALYVRNGDELYAADFPDPNIETKLRESAARSCETRDENTGEVVTPIRLGGEPIGSLAVSGGAFSDAAFHSLLNLVAIALERASSQRAVTRAEVARQSEELKSTLLDAIAHEFKTPLTSIKAVTTDMLSSESGALPAHQQELISIVDDAADRLSKLVTDAIQLARIEGGTFRLNLGDHFPNSLIAGALRQMKSLTEEREIRVMLPDQLPVVRVDADLIQLVITHLLDNALKYSSPNGPIVISADAADGKVIVHVSDSGHGIRQEEQAHIFEKFYRAKNEHHLKGTGMGLSIAREIMRAHGEDIWLSSRPGEGSRFSFSLPIAYGGNTQ
ncbi:MAG TPA: ATP-binding protein [Terracidiphilus sp.]|jgi:two-component system sensor histidine kinase KdpD